MRSIVLMVLAAMALTASAEACGCGGGGLDGVGGPKMIEEICPNDYTIRGPRMTYDDDGRFGVALVVDPSGGASMAFVGGEEGRGLVEPARYVTPNPSEGLSINKQVALHLKVVPGDLLAFQEMMAAIRGVA